MPGVAFTKTEAHGNDFLLVSDEEILLEDGPRLARSMCHRFSGVGADGLILYHAGRGEFAMTLFNSDGSSAEISGNGLRCLAAYLFHRGLAGAETIEVETGAGRLALSLVERRENRFRFRANMGRPRLAARDVPFQAEPATERAVSVPLDVQGEKLEVTALSVGNPHCVVFTRAFDVSELRRIGPAIESHPRFPRKTNVELVQLLSPNEIRLGVWERGAGETASSGTGSAAAAVAAILNGLVTSPVHVRCEGGTLTVEWETGNSVFLTGDARVVAEGNYFGDERGE